MREHARVPHELVEIWRERSRLLNEFGDPNSARLWEVAATELEQVLRLHDDESLTLSEAARLTGYTPEHLGTLVRRGAIPNAGRPKAPRVRRSDLPTKQPHGPGRPSRRRRPLDDTIRKIGQQSSQEER
jgi:hypothetical protein